MITQPASAWCRTPRRLLCALLSLIATLIATSAHAGLALTWNMAFSPDTIGPGSTGTLTYTLSNNSSNGVRGVAFANVLPAGVRLADPAHPIINCEGTLSAPDGGTTITLTEGQVPGNGSCIITVQVTSAAEGTHTNVTGDLTSDFGNSGTASADLTVNTSLPGFSKSFSPRTIGLGGRSTLTFTIDNSANEGPRNNLTFTDVLPAGLVIAHPPNVVNNCGGGTVNATPGSSTISLIQSFPAASVGAFQTCTISVDVTAESVGRLLNLSGALSSTLPQQFDPVSSGRASAALNVTVSPIVFRKTFIDDPATPGSSTRVEYTIVNRSRTQPLTDISFTDDFGAALSGLAATGLPASDWCGPGSQLTGTSLLRLSGGSLPPEGSCTFRVPLQVPATAAPGSYPGTTSQIQATLGGTTVLGPAAADTLFVDVAPTLTKTFLQSAVTPGDPVTMRFRITNNSSNATVTEIAFQDELPAELSFTDPQEVTVPANGFCGPNSAIDLIPLSQFNDSQVIISGAELAPGASCTFDIILPVADGAKSGLVTNTTSPITAMIAGTSVTGNAATATLEIVSGPRLSKAFLDNPVVPGEIARLEYTLSFEVETLSPAQNISFTDNLESALPGLVAVGLPLSSVCGPDSLVRGTSVIDFRGGQLAPGEVCTFVVEVLVPANATIGTITNTTSVVTSQVGGTTVRSGPATANFLISGLSLAKEFLGPVIPGGTGTLRFTITNAGTIDATEIVFTDDLDAALTGMTGVGLPLSEICGRGSSLTGAGNPSNSLLIFQGGTVSAQRSCSFEVSVRVPASTPEGFYGNATSALSARLGEQSVSLPAATGVLEVSDRYLELTKSFPSGTADAGTLTTLEFTLTNIHPTLPVDGIAFTDPLPGSLVSTAGTVNGICGAGSQLTGATTLSINIPSLAAGKSCTFSVTVAIPVRTPPGRLTNTTSEVSGRIASQAVRGDPASAAIEVGFPFVISELRERPDGGVVVAWSGTPGRLYCVEWTEDLKTWNAILPAVRVDSGSGQWIDRGPPFTPTPPMDSVRRFYRVVAKDSE